MCSVTWETYNAVCQKHGTLNRFHRFFAYHLGGTKEGTE